VRIDRETGRRTSRPGERAILLGLEGRDGPPAGVEPLEELERLAETAGARTLEKTLQRRARPDPTTFVGTGKADEVGRRVKELRADLVIVDHDLSPSQGRNLEKAVGARVVDRTELILDIFARRARTAMAQAQVELAQMEYSLPRLKRLWTHLNREVGSGRAGIGVRGPGEKQLETDRRLVRRKIRDLRHALVAMRAHRERQTRARGRWFSTCLVGYTNAGKSTILRALTGADVLVQDRLFSTLDTTTRSWEVAPGKRVFLSDTVGFIRDLPHHLVSSFLATLEEARQADLLLVVVDASHPDATGQVDVVEETLSRIGAGGVPRIPVLNQMDKVRDPLALRLLESRLPGAVRVSGLTGEGLPDLAAAVLGFLTRRHLDLLVEVDAGSGRLLARLSEVGEVTDTTWTDGVARVRVRLPPRHLGEIRRMGGRILEGAPPEPSLDDAE
jgi:GTP-binding protein HflX